VLRSGRGRRW